MIDDILFEFCFEEEKNRKFMCYTVLKRFTFFELIKVFNFFPIGVYEYKHA